MAFDGYNGGSGNGLTSDQTLAHGIGTGDFSVAGWVYRVAANTGTYLYQNGALGSTFAVQVSDGALGRFAIWCSGTYRFDSTITTGVWTHLGVSRRSGVFYGYVNGVEEATAVTNSQNLTTQSQIVSGREYVGELALWTQGLSATEMAALAKRENPDTVKPSALSAYWDFIRSTKDKWKNALTMTTNNGAAAFVAHPPMNQSFFAPHAHLAAGGGGGGSSGTGRISRLNSLGVF